MPTEKVKEQILIDLKQRRKTKEAIQQETRLRFYKWIFEHKLGK